MVGLASKMCEDPELGKKAGEGLRPSLSTLTGVLLFRFKRTQALASQLILSLLQAVEGADDLLDKVAPSSARDIP